MKRRSHGAPFLLLIFAVMHLHSYLQSSKKILEEYQGETPFAVHLKNHFAANKKFGSKDRKQVSQLCYSFFRLGKSFEKYSIEDQLLAGQFLTTSTSNPYLEQYRPEWNMHIQAGIEEKYKTAGGDISQLFPFTNELSNAINATSFAASMLTQPDLFIRMRPGFAQKVHEKLSAAGIYFQQESPDALRLSNTTKVQEYIELDKEAVVQDLNSQRVLNAYFEQNITPKHAWDCCAASGGKSILLHDHVPQIRLIVNDIRESILANLKKRFIRAGIKSFEAFKADLSKYVIAQSKKLDLIISDVPCSGSGTWGRTPEQLQYFSLEQIDKYAQLQKSIATNAAASLKNSGYFVYITCSVFSKENEAVVQHLLAHTNLQLLSQQYLIGYDKKADTMFTALFKL